MPDLSPPSLDDQVACVEREIGYRERVYPRRVTAGQMTPALADRELRRMRAVLETLRRFRDGMVLLRDKTEMASCDCCGKMVPRADIGRVIAYGIETFVCGQCRGEEVEDA